MRHPLARLADPAALDLQAAGELWEQVFAKAGADLHLGAMLTGLEARAQAAQELGVVAKALRERLLAAALDPAPALLLHVDEGLGPRPDAIAPDCAQPLPTIAQLDRVRRTQDTLFGSRASPQGLNSPWRHLAWLAHPLCPARIVLALREPSQLEILARAAGELGAQRVVAVSADAWFSLAQWHKGVLERWTFDPRSVVRSLSRGDLAPCARTFEKNPQKWLTALALWVRSDDDRSALLDTMRRLASQAGS